MGYTPHLSRGGELYHYRTKGSKNGVSNTAGYKAIGSIAKGKLINGKWVYDTVNNAKTALNNTANKVGEFVTGNKARQNMYNKADEYSKAVTKSAENKYRNGNRLMVENNRDIDRRRAEGERKTAKWYRPDEKNRLRVPEDQRKRQSDYSNLNAEWAKESQKRADDSARLANQVNRERREDSRRDYNSVQNAKREYDKAKNEYDKTLPGLTNKAGNWLKDRGNELSKTANKTAKNVSKAAKDAVNWTTGGKKAADRASSENDKASTRARNMSSKGYTNAKRYNEDIKGYNKHMMDQRKIAETAEEKASDANKKFNDYMNLVRNSKITANDSKSLGREDAQRIANRMQKMAGDAAKAQAEATKERGRANYMQNLSYQSGQDYREEAQKNSDYIRAASARAAKAQKEYEKSLAGRVKSAGNWLKDRGGQAKELATTSFNTAKEKVTEGGSKAGDFVKNLFKKKKK